MIRYFGSSERTSSRSNSMTALFSKGGEANARIRFLSFPKFLRLRRVYIPVASILIVMLVLGGIFVLPSLLHKSPVFPVLCSGNFQSAKTSTSTATVPTPATSIAPDGEPIGLSEGANIFDLQRPNQQEVQEKFQAAQAVKNNPQDVMRLLKNAISSDQTDAEVQIYLENWQVLGSNHPHITFVVGVSFVPTASGSSRGALQGAYTAQKECNDHNQQDDSKAQVVLMIANISGNSPGDRASSAKVVANQIADQAGIDPTIVGIMGWSTSANSINVNHQLKIRGSHLPMVSSTSSSDELEGMSNFFRICPRDAEQAQIAANFVLKTKQKKRIAILFDQTDAYGDSLKDDFAQDIPNDRVASAGFAGSDSKTLQDALKTVLAQNPDAIFFSGHVSDLVALLNDISSTPSANLLIVAGDALATTNDYPDPPPDMHNVYFTSFASPTEWDGNDPKPPFFRDYKTNFGTLTAPTGFLSVDVSVMLSYDALSALLHGSQQVLSTKNTISASDLTQALRQTTGANAIQGITGHIAFDSNGDQDPGKMIFVEHIEGTHLVIDEAHGCLLKEKCSS